MPGRGGAAFMAPQLFREVTIFEILFKVSYRLPEPRGSVFFGQ